MDRDPFKEYIKQSEPSKRDKGYAWHLLRRGLRPCAFTLKVKGALVLIEYKL